MFYVKKNDKYNVNIYLHKFLCTVLQGSTEVRGGVFWFWFIRGGLRSGRCWASSSCSHSGKGPGVSSPF